VETIEVATHGRYLVRESSSRPPDGILLGFHGYGQNARAFSKDLDVIPATASWTTVSVQGLHRFYTKAGEVVASWMTREDRELAIDDNIRYVQAVVDRVRSDNRAAHPASPLPLVFLGFSQGVAMAFRAAAALTGCSGIIALGGDIPPEIRASSLRLPPVLVGRGKHDAWYTSAKLAVDLSWLESMDIETTVCEYGGGHEWTDDFRARSSEFLMRLARSARGL
jgi:predicted esterase